MDIYKQKKVWIRSTVCGQEIRSGIVSFEPDFDTNL